LAENFIQLFFFEEPVTVHGMSMRQYFPRTFPVSKRVGGYTEILGRISDLQKITQFIHVSLRPEKKIP
jgi:hypothetical protein